MWIPLSIITQHILCDFNGIVQQSDNLIFKVPLKKPLKEIHPFFEQLPDIIVEKNQIDIQCVNLDFTEKEVIVDINLFRNDKGLSIIVQDLTKHYQNYHLTAQQKNESFLEAELLNEKNQMLESREVHANMFMEHFTHELRNPLMHLISFADLLSKTELSIEQRNYLDYIDRSGRRMSKILGDVFDLAIPRKNITRPSTGPFSIVAFLGALNLFYSGQCEKKGLIFKMNIDGKIPEVLESDERALFHILSNLLDNAIAFTDQGMVELKVLLNHKWGRKINLGFQVHDTGVGIKKKDLPHIFGGFAQFDNTIGNYGPGMGLNVVKKLLTGLKSELNVISGPRGGSVFYFDLSLSVIRTALPGLSVHLKKAVSKTTSSPQRKKRKRVLIIESDKEVQMILFKYLLEDKRFLLDCFDSVEVAIDSIGKVKYDLVILDLGLLSKNEVVLTQEIKTLSDKAGKGSLPILGTSLKFSSKGLAHYEKCGLEFVLAIPFSRSELMQAVNGVW